MDRKDFPEERLATYWNACHPSLKVPLAKALLECNGLDDEFWLGASTIDGSKWAELSYAHAMEIWKDLESPNDRVLHAADFLSGVQYRREIHQIQGGALGTTTTLVPSEVMYEVKDHDAILAALRDRLVHLLENPSKITEKVALTRSSKQLSRPDLPYFRDYQIAEVPNEEIRYARILTGVTSRLFLGEAISGKNETASQTTAEVRKLLNKIAMTRIDEIAKSWSEYHELINLWDYPKIESGIDKIFLTRWFREREVRWPLESMGGTDIELLRANLLFAELIHLSGDPEPLEIALLQAQQLAMKNEALQHDANQDGKLSYEEVAEYLEDFKQICRWAQTSIEPLEPARLDLDGDKSITVEELNQFRVADWKEWAEQLAKSEARVANEFMSDSKYVEWAQKVFARYDKDKDGKLSKSETQRMLLRPPAGADKNNDGFISVQEYAEMRAKRR